MAKDSIGTAYVQIVPSFDGGIANISSKLSSSVNSSSIGTSIGSGLVAGISGAFTNQALQFIGNALSSVADLAIDSTKKLLQTTMTEITNAEQNIGGLDVVFQDSAESMKKWANSTTKSIGTSFNSAAQTANKIGAILQGSDFSIQKSATVTQSIMKRAADMARAMGISVEEGFTAVTHMAKGEYALMDNLGVKMNDTTVKTYALSKGFEGVWKDATPSEKIPYAIDYFMEKTSQFANQTEREANTIATSWDMVKASFLNVVDGIENTEVDEGAEFVSSFNTFVQNVLNKINEVGPQILTSLSVSFANIGTDIWYNLIDDSEETINTLKEKASGVVEQIKTAVSEAWKPKKDELNGKENEKATTELAEVYGISKEEVEEFKKLLEELDVKDSDFLDNTIEGFKKLGKEVGGVITKFQNWADEKVNYEAETLADNIMTEKKSVSELAGEYKSLQMTLGYSEKEMATLMAEHGVSAEKIKEVIKAVDEGAEKTNKKMADMAGNAVKAKMELQKAYAHFGSGFDDYGGETQTATEKQREALKALGEQAGQTAMDVIQANDSENESTQNTKLQELMATSGLKDYLSQFGDVSTNTAEQVVRSFFDMDSTVGVSSDGIQIALGNSETKFNEFLATVARVSGVTVEDIRGILNGSIELNETNFDTIKSALTSVGANFGLTKAQTDKLLAAIIAVQNQKIDDKEFTITSKIEVQTNYKNAKIADLMHAQGYAVGGVITRPQLAMVGEDGPEVVMPLKNNTQWIDVLAGRIVQLGGAGGNRGDTYNIQATDPLETASVIARKRKQQQLFSMLGG